MRRAWWSSSCIVAAAAACGDNANAGVPLSFASCGTRAPSAFECATLVVPADWSDPAGQTIALRVVRAAARDPAHRIGVLSFNFGGPGAPTIAPITREYPHHPIMSMYDLTQNFDFVAMDWRGVGQSMPALSCLDASTAMQLATETFLPRSDAEWTQLFQLVADAGAGCTANVGNASLVHVDTASAARDLDALRSGLGEDTLNLWVVSYGSRLGAMYALLFPDHVPPIASDAPLVPVPDF